jgi:triacylglycerol esterase/lipase EstA (alpha/beta hydrolase family)
VHADGVKTTYSFLRDVSVVVGQRVVAGENVGHSESSVHVSVRYNGYYLDPLILFDGDTATKTRLIATTPDEPGLESDDGLSLLKLAMSPFASTIEGVKSTIDAFRAMIDAGLVSAQAAVDMAGWLLVQAYNGVVEPALQQLLVDLEILALAITHADPLRLTLLQLSILSDVLNGQKCTPVGTPAQTVDDLTSRKKIIVQVAGFGSSASADKPNTSGAFQVDTESLGYDDADVIRFSYAGGTTMDNDYDSQDSSQDLNVAAKRLTDLLAELRAQNPDAHITVVGHSQGGVVARDAITRPGSEDLNVDTVVTIGSPHQGSSIALMTLAEATLGGERVINTIADLKDLNPHGSAQQLTPGSDYLRELNERTLPEDTWFTSIGGRGDVVVPAADAALREAHNVVLDVPAALGGVHTALPSDPQVMGEILRAINRQEPTCRSVSDRYIDSVRARGGQALMRLVGTGAAVGSTVVGSPGMVLPDLGGKNGTDVVQQSVAP